eukprot:gene7408-11731_t
MRQQFLLTRRSVVEKPRKICALFGTDCIEILHLGKETNFRYFQAIYTIYPGNCTVSNLPVPERPCFVSPHIHILADEEYRVIEGSLSYIYENKRGILNKGEFIKFEKGKAHLIKPNGPNRLIVKITRTPGIRNYHKYYENYFGLRRDSGEKLKFVDWVAILRDMKRYDIYPADIPKSIFYFFGEFCEAMCFFLGIPENILQYNKL